MPVLLFICLHVVPKNIHTHPIGYYWKFQWEEGGVKGQNILKASVNINCNIFSSWAGLGGGGSSNLKLATVEGRIFFGTTQLKS